MRPAGDLLAGLFYGQNVRELRDDFIENGRDYDDLDSNAMAIDPPRKGWKTFARDLSMRFGGQFWAGKHALTWSCGRHVEFCVDRFTVQQIAPARRAAASIGIEKPGWTAGKLARQAIRFIDSPQRGTGNCEGLINEKQFGYYSCEPGRYEDLSMFDVTSCYWQIFSLMPSIRVVFHEGAKRIQFMAMSESELARFGEVKRAFNSCKHVRNTILGCLIGSETAAYYTGGEKKYFHLPPSPNRAAGWVIVRTAWELTQAAAIESDSVLTMVDSVCTKAFHPPPIWEAVGLSVKRVAWGASDIVRPGVYQVGERTTVDYWHGDRERRSVPHEPIPDYQIGVWL